jgi:hypothetical protein
MNFVQKLTEDTKNGMWDFAWKYNDGSQNYTFNKDKHILRGMNFSLTEPMMIFPNGYVIYYKEDLMKNLAKEIDVSLERTIDESIVRYMVGNPLSPEQEEVAAEQEANKSTEPKVKDVKNGRSS